MARFGLRSAAAIAAVAAGMAFAATPATADPTGLTFWAGDFSGTSTSYATPGTDCTALPFVAHSELNQTTSGFRVYESTDCSGPALSFPANDIHSFLGFDARSFQAAD